MPPKRVLQRFEPHSGLVWRTTVFRPWGWLILLSLLFMLLLGIWWLASLYRLSGEMAVLYERLGEDPSQLLLRLRRMFFSEGLFFLIIAWCPLAGLLWVFLRDGQRSRALHQFMAAMTHELRTPLATLHLKLETLEKEHPGILAELERFEAVFERGLQLARVQGAKRMQLMRLSGWDLEMGVKARFPSVEIQMSRDWSVLADPEALWLVLRNLVENSQRHSGCPKASLKMILDCKVKGMIVYRDNGRGCASMPSPRGLGLHLCQALMKQMHAKVRFLSQNGFTAQMEFQS